MQTLAVLLLAMNVANACGEDSLKPSSSWTQQRRLPHAGGIQGVYEERPRHASRIRCLLKLFDQDNDGKLTREEFIGPSVK
jgi:hypothetical protein